MKKSATSGSAQPRHDVSNSMSKSVGIDGLPSGKSLAFKHYQLTGRYSSNLDTRVKASQYLDMYGDGLHDTVLVYLVCSKHEKVALSKIGSKGLFLPYGPLRSPSESMFEAADNVIQRVTELEKKVVKKPMYSQLVCLDDFRIQMPVYYDFVTRYLFRAELTAEGCEAGLCKDNSEITWYPKNNLPLNELSCPEVLIDWTKPDFHELTIDHVLFSSVSYPIFDDPKRPHVQKENSEHKELLQFCGYTEADVLLIYGDYLQHCFPSEFMTFALFESYLTKVDLTLASEQTQLRSVFRAFAYNQQDYINFHEFLLGLAMVDLFNGAATKSKPSPILMQAQSLFWSRYYAQQENFITEKELSKAIEDFKLNKSSGMFSAVSPLAHLRNHQAWPAINHSRMYRSNQKDSI